MSSVRLLNFTDPHLYGDERDSLRGVETLPALERAVAHARRNHWTMDAFLVTGDLVQDDPAGYVHFKRVFGALGKPVYCIPGNHDELDAMRETLGEEPFRLHGHVDLDGWRVVLLDSCIPDAAGGRLSDESLAQLESALETARGRHVLVCLHHHPVRMSSRWLDQVGLENADDFFRVIDRHENTRAVLWGHVHQAFDRMRGRVRLMSTPSTCTQFLPNSEEFAIDHRPPAYRPMELRPDGTIETEVVWVPE
jgi:3',5'-cyclic-AMP phosphodiesterase